MRSTVRCFIALEIAPQTRSAIDRAIRALSSRTTSVKWVLPDQFHLTLKFLGDVPTNELHLILRAVEKACAEIDPYDLWFSGLGAFPNLQNPHTLWVGLNEGIEETCFLAAAIETELEKIGYPKEHRVFTPHLTLGRIRKGETGDLSAITTFLAEQAETSFGLSEADAVTVFSSELSRSGPKYEVLAEIDLKR